MTCAAPHRRKTSPPRGGFSLLEVILATAVLAGSGAALFALIGQASKLAVRAEQRSEALQIAESVLDEFIAMGGRQQSEMNGLYEANPAWAYQVQVDTLLATRRQSSTGQSSTGQSSTDTSLSRGPTRLVRISVSVFPAGASDGGANELAGGGQLDGDSSEQRGTVQLVGWARLPAGGAGTVP